MYGSLELPDDSRSMSQNKDYKKLRFLSKRVHPLEFYPLRISVDTNSKTLKKKASIAKDDSKSTISKESSSLNSPSNMFSMKIPPLRYASFKKKNKKVNNILIPNRRGSDGGVPMFMFLANKYKIEVPVASKELTENKPKIKESIINKRAFKRIESHEIEYPSKSLGEKLIRVQQLVIDPLLMEGNFEID